MNLQSTKNRVDAFINGIKSHLDNYQTAPYWQGLKSHSVNPKHTTSTDDDVTPDQLDSEPKPGSQHDQTFYCRFHPQRLSVEQIQRMLQQATQTRIDQADVPVVPEIFNDANFKEDPVKCSRDRYRASNPTTLYCGSSLVTQRLLQHSQSLPVRLINSDKSFDEIGEIEGMAFRNQQQEISTMLGGDVVDVEPDQDHKAHKFIIRMMMEDPRWSRFTEEQREAIRSHSRAHDEAMAMEAQVAQSIAEPQTFDPLHLLRPKLPITPPIRHQVESRISLFTAATKHRYIPHF